MCLFAYPESLLVVELRSRCLLSLRACNPRGDPQNRMDLSWFKNPLMSPTLLVSNTGAEQSQSQGPADLEGLGSKPTSGPASILQKWPFILQQGQNLNADTNTPGTLKMRS